MKKMKHIFLILISVVLLLPNLNVGKVSANLNNLTTNQLNTMTYIMNPISQVLQAEVCLLDGVVPFLPLSKAIFINGGVNQNQINSNGSLKGVSGISSTRVITDFPNKNHPFVTAYIGVNFNVDGDLFAHSSRSYVNSYIRKLDPYIDYNLLINEEEINLTKGLYPIYDGKGYNTTLVEEVYILKIEDYEKYMAEASDSLVSLSLGEYLYVDGYVQTFAEYARVNKNKLLSKEGYVDNFTKTAYVLKGFTTIKKGKSISNSNNVNPIEVSFIDDRTILKDKVSYDYNRLVDIGKLMPFAKKVYDVRDNNSYETKYKKYSLEYGAFTTKVANLDSDLVGEGRYLTKLNNYRPLPKAVYGSCNPGDIILSVMTIKSSFLDRDYPLGSAEVIAYDPKEDPTPTPPINIKPEDVVDSEPDGPEDKLKGESGTDLIDQNLEVEEGLNIRVNNIPDNGKVISGDSYFTPQVQIFNRGNSSKLILDSNTSATTEYIATQWKEYEDTKTITDLILFKVNGEINQASIDSIKFEDGNNIEGLTQLDFKSNISSSTDFSAFNLRENGSYLFAVKSIDSEDNTKVKVVYKQFNLSFNDNIGALPVKNNLLFNINDKQVFFNNKKSSNGISSLKSKEFNSLTVNSSTSQNGDTLIANHTGSVSLFNNKLNNKLSKQLEGIISLNDVESYGNGFLISSNKGLTHFSSDSMLDTNLFGISEEIKDTIISGDYIISTIGNRVSLLNINLDQSDVIEGITVTHDSNLNKIEDLGKLLVSSEEGSSKLVIISKR